MTVEIWHKMGSVRECKKILRLFKSVSKARRDYPTYLKAIVSSVKIRLLNRSVVEYCGQNSIKGFSDVNGDSEKLRFQFDAYRDRSCPSLDRRNKMCPYEVDSITPFVAINSVMSHFYRAPEQYKAHLAKEGELVQTQREWQHNNGTYSFSDGLGTVEILIGLLVLSGIFSVSLGALGAVLAFLTSFVTLSFLITTPEAWVSALGDSNHGFPYHSGAGRLVIKDVMLWAGGFLLMVDSARALRLRYSHSSPIPKLTA